MFTVIRIAFDATLVETTTVALDVDRVLRASAFINRLLIRRCPLLLECIRGLQGTAVLFRERLPRRHGDEGRGGDESTGTPPPSQRKAGTAETGGGDGASLAATTAGHGASATTTTLGTSRSVAGTQLSQIKRK